MNILHHRAGTCTQNIIEHTPIYDLAAYNRRKRRQQILRYRKNTASLLMFFITLILPVSLLFIGG